MTRHLSADSRGHALARFATPGISPGGLEQLKIDRLRELQAVIDSLRCEQHQDRPLDRCSERVSTAAR